LEKPWENLVKILKKPLRKHWENRENIGKKLRNSGRNLEKSKGNIEKP
jgi:hypothetical protein